eukprot:TRINITY_DN33198_c0_g1_i1.p1 TRINITY_DN33198_c0_g1~~TRINITY_DN33198_c0_g1_i1.p1  ORF type:complete len:583 (+),score=62.03 TRINITY_DN33198_c0_g1_i1:143-1750(+)
MKNRRLQEWGGVVHGKGLIAQPLPPWLTAITKRMKTDAGDWFPSPINHVLVNEYGPGQGIMAHQDGPVYFPVVAILSLGAPATMDFTPHSRFTTSSSATPDTTTPLLQRNGDGNLVSPSIICPRQRGDGKSVAHTATPYLSDIKSIEVEKQGIVMAENGHGESRTRNEYAREEGPDTSVSCERRDGEQVVSDRCEQRACVPCDRGEQLADELGTRGGERVSPFPASEGDAEAVSRGRASHAQQQSDRDSRILQAASESDAQAIENNERHEPSAGLRPRNEGASDPSARDEVALDAILRNEAAHTTDSREAGSMETCSQNGASSEVVPQEGRVRETIPRNGTEQIHRVRAVREVGKFPWDQRREEGLSQVQDDSTIGHQVPEAMSKEPQPPCPEPGIDQSRLDTIDKQQRRAGEQRDVGDEVRPPRFSVKLKRRSLLVFKDAAYSDYLHGIAERRIEEGGKVPRQHDAKEVAQIATGSCVKDNWTCMEHQEVEANSLRDQVNNAAQMHEEICVAKETRVSLTCRVVLNVRKNLLRL